MASEIRLLIINTDIMTCNVWTEFDSENSQNSFLAVTETKNTIVQTISFYFNDMNIFWNILLYNNIKYCEK